MNGILLSEIILFVIALTMDSFVISFAYGISKCKPSLGVVIMMNGVCSLVLGIALIAGGFLGNLNSGLGDETNMLCTASAGWGI